MKKLGYLIGSFFVCLAFSCGDFLNVKPDKKMATPTTAKALRALLDDNYTLNTLSSGLGEANADNYYVEDVDLAKRSVELRNTYMWEENGASETAYLILYRKINIANIVLEELDKISSTSIDLDEMNFLKGAALFIRANAYLTLANVFVKQFDESSSPGDLGLPLRLSSNFNDRSFRSSASDTYSQIEKDALGAMELLPEFSEHPMRPSKWAAYGLLSRLYLSMRDFDRAEKYSDLCLAIKSDLIDFNELNEKSNYPVPAFNTEVMYNTHGSSVNLISGNFSKIPDDLYNLYEDNDLRKGVFFKINADGSKQFKGSYYGSNQLFTGFAIDEVYLTKSECLARRNETEIALDVLNALLIKRYDKSAFIEKEAKNPKEVLDLILIERRKELILRDIRFMDLKRLNVEDDYKLTLKRSVGGKVYELPPNDNRYAVSLPIAVISISGMEQNPR